MLNSVNITLFKEWRDVSNFMLRGYCTAFKYSLNEKHNGLASSGPPIFSAQAGMYERTSGFFFV